jgi:hypothetical protein
MDLGRILRILIVPATIPDEPGPVPATEPPASAAEPAPRDA